MSRWNIWAWCSLFSREGWVRGQTGLEKTWDQWRPDLPKNKLHIMLEGPTHRLLFLHQQNSECKSEKTNCGGLGTRLLQGHSLDTAEAGVVPLLWWVTGSIGLGCNSVEFVKQQHLVASGALAQSSYGWILHSFSARGTLWHKGDFQQLTGNKYVPLSSRSNFWGGCWEIQGVE